MNAKVLLEEAGKNEEKLISIRHHLHQNPEIGFELNSTLDFVRAELEAMGYQVESCGRSGLTATVGKPGKVFMLRADMDALPINEEAEVDFASHNGYMHACGHDMHTSMLLGAAMLLKEHEEELCGTVKLDFQPSEETFEGAKDMISSGLLTNPQVDAALMIHVSAGLPMESGTVIVSSGGVTSPAADCFTIKVQGKGSHGSMPDQGVDPISIAAHIITSLQEIHARELNQSDEVVLTFGSINGGIADNVIPDVVNLSGTIRTYNEDTREFVKMRLAEITENVAKTFRGEAKVEFVRQCPTLLNNEDLSCCAYKYTRELLGERMTFTTGQLISLSGGKPSRSGGSEDFSYVSHEVPSIMLALAAGNINKGFIYPQHHPKVRFDDSVLATGSAVYAYNAISWLEEHSK